MTEHNTALTIIVLVLALGVFVYLGVLLVRSKKPAPGGATVAPLADVDEDVAAQRSKLLLRFVEDAEGVRRGETVVVDGERLIIKDGQTFFAAPVDAFEPAGDVVRVKGNVDWEQARRDGEAWRERSHKVISYSDEELPKEEDT